MVLKRITRRVSRLRRGVHVEVINRLGIIHVDCGLMPPAKAEEHLKRQSEILNEAADLKTALDVDSLLFCAMHRA